MANGNGVQVPVRVQANRDGTVSFTLRCGCGSPAVCLTITDVPPFTLKVAQSLFDGAMRSDPKTTRLAVKCSGCGSIDSEPTVK